MFLQWPMLGVSWGYPPENKSIKSVLIKVWYQQNMSYIKKTSLFCYLVVRKYQEENCGQYFNLSPSSSFETINLTHTNLNKFKFKSEIRTKNFLHPPCTNVTQYRTSNLLTSFIWCWIFNAARGDVHVGNDGNVHCKASGPVSTW